MSSACVPILQSSTWPCIETKGSKNEWINVASVHVNSHIAATKLASPIKERSVVNYMHGMCLSVLSSNKYIHINKNPLSSFQCIECIKSCHAASSVCDPIARRSGTTTTIYRAERKRLAGLDGRGGVLAVAGGALGDGLGLVAGGGALELLADLLDGRSAGGGDSGGAAEVGVDTGEELARVGLLTC
jgi:hypothetical protein